MPALGTPGSSWLISGLTPRDYTCHARSPLLGASWRLVRQWLPLSFSAGPDDAFRAALSGFLHLTFHLSGDSLYLYPLGTSGERTDRVQLPTLRVFGVGYAVLAFTSFVCSPFVSLSAIWGRAVGRDL